ncbi:MAG: hypothetical protein ACOYM9_06155 [Bradymonadia bacterium]
MALVIKKWRAEETTDAEGNYVYIHGREEGLLSWLLNVVGIDATTTFRVTDETVIFEQGSLAGDSQRIIPISSLSSSFFGFFKPWREALALGLVLLPAFGLGLFVGPLYDYLNKKLGLGVVEVSGLTSGIEFKRPLIEGQNIDENQSRRVIAILRTVTERSKR